MTPFHSSKSAGIAVVAALWLGVAHVSGLEIAVDQKQEILAADFFDAGFEVDFDGDAPQPVSEDAQLRFHDGSTLRGTFTGIESEKRRILWRHPDATSPLSLPLGSVRSISLNQAAEGGRGPVTVKFTGGDWVTATILEIQPEAVRLQLPDNAELTVLRDQIEWMYMGEALGPDCYDGPTNLSGWNSDGSWAFREGALRASRPSPVGRMFDRLPDKVDYFFEIDQQGELQAFSFTMRAANSGGRAVGNTRVQLMFSGTDLRLWAQVGNEMKMEQVDLRRPARAEADIHPEGLPRKQPMQYRVLEDYTAGRLIIFIDGRKVADWTIAKGEPGKNSGGITFQPMVWNGQRDQSINRVRVMPWDGRIPENGLDLDAREETDSVSLLSGEVVQGNISQITADKIAIETVSGPKDLAKSEVSLVRFRRSQNPPDEDPPIARLRLVKSGEFDVSGLKLENGTFLARAAFGRDLRIPAGSLRSIDFAGSGSMDVVGDVLVFRNGDRLAGTFTGMSGEAELAWTPRGGEEPVHFSRPNIAGVVLAAKESSEDLSRAAIARFRNGDLLAGEFESRYLQHLQIKAISAGSVAAPRDQLQALYFSGGAGVPVLDGSTNSERWVNTEDFRRAAAAQNNRTLEPLKALGPSPWRYFNGNFAYLRPESGVPASRTNLFLGRILENMAKNVEIRFTVTSQQGSPAFSAQLFTEPSSPGYMLQFHSAGIFINDMVSRPRGGGVFQQQVTYDGKLKTEEPRRTIRVLAERDTARLVVIVDDVVVANIVRKAGERNRTLGRGMAIYPQMNMQCTFSDLWIGPWDSVVPDSTENPNEPHSVLLANGDESRGTVASGTAETLHFESGVGELEMPTNRVTMVRLGKLDPDTTTAKVRLAPMGTLSVSRMRMEQGTLVCESTVLGEVRVPMSAVREIAFATANVPAPEQPK